MWSKEQDIPYLQGYSHASDPMRTDICPYLKGTNEHEEWWLGYMDCVEDALYDID